VLGILPGRHLRRVARLYPSKDTWRRCKMTVEPPKKKSRITARMEKIPCHRPYHRPYHRRYGRARIVHRYGGARLTYRLSPIALGFLQSGEGTFSLVRGQFVKPPCETRFETKKALFPKLWPMAQTTNTPRLCVSSVQLEPLYMKI